MQITPELVEALAAIQLFLKQVSYGEWIDQVSHITVSTSGGSETHLGIQPFVDLASVIGMGD